MSKNEARQRDRMEETRLRPLILKAIDTYPNCDLARRLRKELRRNGDSNTATHHARAKYLADAAAWAADHLVEAFDAPAPGVRGEDAFEAFLVEHPHYRGNYGKRLFYRALRTAKFDIQKCDAFGHVGNGPLVIMGVELAS